MKRKIMKAIAFMDMQQSENVKDSFLCKSSETERDVQAQMEDGFREALLTRFECDKRNANVPFNGHRQAVTGPPVIAEGYRVCCT